MRQVSNVFDKNGTGETAPPESILARAQLYKGWLTRSKGKIDIQQVSISKTLRYLKGRDLSNRRCCSHFERPGPDIN